MPASASEIVSVSIVLPAMEPIVSFCNSDEASAPKSFWSIAFATRRPVAISVYPPRPAILTRPPSTSPLSIAIAAFAAIANGASPGMNCAIAKIGA